MKTRLLRLIVAAVLLISLLPVSGAFAQEHGEGEPTTTASDSRDWGDVQEVALWSLVAIAGGSVVMGILYLLKKSLGGFPENPSWVAPISVMRSRDLPGDDNQGHEAHADHNGHGGHAPAH